MELHSVPKKVLVGTSLEDAMANVSATITFETGITKEVPAAELGFVAVPNMDQVGVKTLVAISQQDIQERELQYSYRRSGSVQRGR